MGLVLVGLSPTKTATSTRVRSIRVRAVTYSRVSTTEQAEAGYSLDAHDRALLRHVESNGWDLIETFQDAGESARSADRPQLKQMLDRIADGDVDILLVHKIDRLARSLSDHVAIRKTLELHGVRLVSISENLEDTASGRLVEGIMASLAEWYSANLSQEIKKGLDEKARRGGYPTLAPIGYLNERRTAHAKVKASS
jgi:DNA invertase Pin-like site-specific DNA recombinase